jgi:hypothetical protein
MPKIHEKKFKKFIKLTSLQVEPNLVCL